MPVNALVQEQHRLINAEHARSLCRIGGCDHVYPYIFEEWRFGVERASTRLRWLRRHGQIGLQWIAAVVMAMPKLQPRTSETEVL